MMKVLSAQGLVQLEGDIVAITDGERGDELGGVIVHGALEEDDPETWDTRALGGDTGGRRRGRPKSGPACVAGVGGAL
jgi:hypothetical protein